MVIPKSIAKIVDQASQQPTLEGKVAVLRKHDSPVLRNLLRMAVDPHVRWLIPEGHVPFKASHAEDCENMLYKEARTLYLYVDGPGGNPNVKPRKREQLFIQLLESLDAADANFLVDVRNHKLPPGIDINVIRAAWPGLI